jgi:hypothetical protein
MTADFFVVPIATWTGQQLRGAFPWEQVSRYLVRDRDHAFEATMRCS